MKKVFCLYSCLATVLWIFVSATICAEPLTHTDNKHRLGYRPLYNGVMAQDPASSSGTDQICIFCHTPHASAPEGQLWNRPEPQKASFPLYAGDLVIDNDLGVNDTKTKSQYGLGVYPNGASRMCMSCHDGVTAIGLLRDNTTIAMLGGVLNKLDADGSFDDTIGAVINLETAHPISFIYDNAVVSDINTARGAGTYQLPMPWTGAGDPDVPLDGQNRMQCTTCHDPHNDTRLDGGALADLPFWRNTSSTGDLYDDVCNACHLAPVANFTSGDPTGTHQLPFPP